MLFKPAPLSDNEKIVLDRIRELKRQLAFSIPPMRWFGFLRRNAFANAVRASNSIEGYNITIDDAIAAVEGEEPLDPKTENWFANMGYRRAMTLVLQKAEAPHFEYSTELLNSLHYMMLEHELPKHPGNWRTGPIFVRDDRANEIVYEGPEIDLVPGLMSALVGELNSPSPGLPATIQAAMAHLNFVMIHPHSDGNGRMGRCLQTLVLARAGTVHPMFASIEEYLGRNTEEYYRVLAEVGGGSWQPNRNTRPWIRFSLTAHFRQATTLLRRSQYYGSLFSELEKTVDYHGLPERAVFALADAAIGYRVRNPTYRKAADIGMRAATRDLRKIVEAGLLSPKGRKRGRYYQASEKLLKTTERVPRPKRVADPFESLEKESMLPGMEGLALPS